MSSLIDEDKIKFAIFKIRKISNLTFEDGEENIFQSSYFENIFDKLIFILKITNDDKLKVIKN